MGGCWWCVHITPTTPSVFAKPPGMSSRSQPRKSSKRASLEDVFSPPMPAPYLHLGLPSTPGSDTRLESFMVQEVVPAHAFHV